VVGSNGAHQILVQLQTAFPTAQFHAIGHSFGCKVWLSALACKDAPRPIDSLILLQGAVSTQAFVEKVSGTTKTVPGGFHCLVAEGRIKGPIIATFTARDLAVRWTFPLASRAAGHVAETDLRERKLGRECYRGMGGWGLDGVTARTFREPGKEY